MAIAISVALHEIFAGLVHPFPHPSDLRETVEHFTIARIEARPTPKPTPPPTPKPPRVVARVPVLAPAQIITRISNATSGKSAHREAIKRAGAARPKPPHIVHAKPIWDTVPTGAQGAGAGNKSGAGSVGNGGTGTGSGDQGNGSGSGTGACGYVEFMPYQNELPHFDRDTGFFTYNSIRMSVHMSDGSVQTVVLDYPWRFKDESVDPFIASNAEKGVPMFFQPPPKALRASEPPLVQYVMEHTNAMGGTKLADCPGMVTPTP